MTPLMYLANICQQIDKTYSVSLEYGCHAGDVPHWQMCVRIPFLALTFSRDLVCGDDMQANISAAQSFGEDIKRFVRGDNTCLAK